MDPIRKLTGGVNLNPIRDRAPVSSNRPSDGAAAQAAASAGETVDVSALITSIQSGMEAAASREAEKAGEIRVAYQAGAYHVEPNQVARAIVEDALW